MQRKELMPLMWSYPCEAKLKFNSLSFWTLRWPIEILCQTCTFHAWKCTHESETITCPLSTLGVPTLDGSTNYPVTWCKQRSWWLWFDHIHMKLKWNSNSPSLQNVQMTYNDLLSSMYISHLDMSFTTLGLPTLHKSLHTTMAWMQAKGLVPLIWSYPHEARKQNRITQRAKLMSDP